MGEIIKLINKGGLEDLEKIEGIDRNMAQRILDYRELNGEFKHIEALIRIPGFTSEIIARLKNFEGDK